MPFHDWTRVTDGTFHAFHLSWVSAIQGVLNRELLPESYYAQAEQIIGPDGVSGEQAEEQPYEDRRRTLLIRHDSDDYIVALLEIVSPGNKSSRNAVRMFVAKALEVLARGFHLLFVDLFPPTPRDPQDLHGLIWRYFGTTPFELPADRPLTLAAYSAGPRKRAYVEPTTVGRELLEMPLFLDEGTYINVPLEATYQVAYRDVPRRWRTVLEAPAE